MEKLLETKDFSLLATSDLSESIASFFAMDYQSEVHILSKFYSDLLLFAGPLNLSPSKEVALLDIGRALIRTGSLGHKEPLGATLELLRVLLERSEFNYYELTSLSDYFFTDYFQHFELFQRVFSKNQSKHVRSVELYIDAPVNSMPLCEAVQRTTVLDKATESPASQLQSRRDSHRVSHFSLLSKSEFEQPKRSLLKLEPSEGSRDSFDLTLEQTVLELDEKLLKTHIVFEKSLEELRNQ